MLGQLSHVSGKEGGNKQALFYFLHPNRKTLRMKNTIFRTKIKNWTQLFDKNIKNFAANHNLYTFFLLSPSSPRTADVIVWPEAADLLHTDIYIYIIPSPTPLAHQGGETGAH